MENSINNLPKKYKYHSAIVAKATLAALALCLMLLLTSDASAQKRLLCLSWNAESGENDKYTIAKRLAEFEGFDIIGLTEVKSENAELYADAASTGEGADGSDSPNFDHVVGTAGGADRMMIIWDNNRLEKIGDLEELDDLNEGNHRAPMFCKFKIRDTGIEFLFMVNHLARVNSDLRNRQAEGLAQWADDQTLPVIAVGDYNYDFDIDDGVGNEGYNNMLAGDHWTWLKPDRLQQTQLSPSYYSVLDFIFTANMPDTWEGTSAILMHLPALDNDAESDHRPVEGHFYIH